MNAPVSSEVYGKTTAEASEPTKSVIAACLAFGQAALCPALQVSSERMIACDRMPTAAFLPSRSIRRGCNCHQVYTAAAKENSVKKMVKL
jgi:hypothetical protein